MKTIKAKTMTCFLSIVIGISGAIKAVAGQENFGVAYNNPPSSYEPKDIYDAMNVNPVMQQPGINGKFRYTKTISGLTCEQSKLIYPANQPVTFTCSLAENLSNDDFKQIYEGLNLIPAKVARMGATTFYKTVGGLNCQLIQKVVMPVNESNETYSCKLNLGSDSVDENSKPDNKNSDDKSYNAEAIYKDLKTKATPQNGGINSQVKNVKSVGRLTCTESSFIVPHDGKLVYACETEENRSNEDFKSIYNALKTKAVKTVKMGATTYVKSVGGLTCTKYSVLVSGGKLLDKYNCKFAGE